MDKTTKALIKKLQELRVKRSKIDANIEAIEKSLGEYEPRPIESDDDNVEALEACDRLMRKGDEMTAEELALLKVISTLIQEYEARRYSEKVV